MPQTAHEFTARSRTIVTINYRKVIDGNLISLLSFLVIVQRNQIEKVEDNLFYRARKPHSHRKAKHE